MTNETISTTFENSEFGTIRTTIIDGEPWFVGKDVARALGYSNSRDALNAHVDKDDKRVIQKSENTTLEIPNRGMTIINESGLYALILASKLPTAKKFKHWVTSEVLPSIRKHGAYISGQASLDADEIIGKAVHAAYQIFKENESKSKPQYKAPECDYARYCNSRYGSNFGTRRFRNLTWEKQQTKKLTAISAKLCINHNEVLHDIYTEIESNYDINLDRVRYDAMWEHRIVNVSVLTAIGINEEVRIIFDTIINSVMVNAGIDPEDPMFAETLAERAAKTWNGVI